MTQHTVQDLVWNIALRTAMTEDSFCINDIIEHGSIEASKQTVRDTMKSMADLGWLEKQSSTGSQWQQGPLMNGENDLTVVTEEKEDPKPLDEVTQPSELNKGEVYIGTVDKASSNALIWIDESNGNHINLGPIDESVVGQEVRFRYIQGVWGKCLEEEFTYDGYNPQSDGSSSSRGSLSSSRSHRTSRTTSNSSRNGTITNNNPNNKNELLKGKL